jgi:hypothetical protein
MEQTWNRKKELTKEERESWLVKKSTKIREEEKSKLGMLTLTQPNAH